MIDTPAPSSKPASGSFWPAVIALFSVLAAGLACFWLAFAATRERSLFHNLLVTGAIILLLTGATYGVAELFRRFRRGPPYVSLPLAALFIASVLLTGSILIINGLLARRHSAPTRNLEELKVIDDAIDQYQREKSADEGPKPHARPSP